MGQMKRAERRERLEREKMASATHFVTLRWRRGEDCLLLDVLDPRSDEPLTRQRQIRDPRSIYNLVQRSLTPTRPSPFIQLLRRNLDEGAGSATIEITGEQYAKLKL